MPWLLRALWPEHVSNECQDTRRPSPPNALRTTVGPRRPLASQQEGGIRRGVERPCLNGARLEPEVCPPPCLDIGPDNTSPWDAEEVQTGQGGICGILTCSSKTKSHQAEGVLIQDTSDHHT